MINGLFCIHKEPGPTSFGVIREFSAILERKLGVRRRDLPSIGHCGTLDPFASGLLLVCVGPAVKLASYLLGDEKTYTGKITFGVRTESGDFDTPTVESSPIRPESLAQIQSAATEFCVGEYLQTPPMYSAKKVGGKALYELARQGKTIARAAVSLRVRDFTVSDFNGESCRFSATVSSGTYIRVLAQDLASRLGTLATLHSLHRTRASGFDITEAVTLGELAEQWPENNRDFPAFFGFDSILRKMPYQDISTETALALYQGRKEVLHTLPAATHFPGVGEESVRALIWDKKLFALVRGRELVRVFSFQWDQSR